MTKGTATTLVFVMGGLLVFLPMVDPKGSTYKRVWGAAVWTTGLAVFADVVPELAGWLAVAVIVAAAAKNQGKLGAFLGQPKTHAPAAASSAAQVARQTVAAG